MSRLVTCGWESGAAAEGGFLSYANTASVYIVSGGRSGGFSLRGMLSSAGFGNAVKAAAIFPLASKPSEVYVRCAVRQAQSSYSDDIPSHLIILADGATWQITVAHHTSQGVLLIYRGTTLIGTASAALGAEWLCLELHALIHASAGTIRLWANGVEVFSFTGDTLESSTAQITHVQIGVERTGGRTYHIFDFDDVAVNDVAGSLNNGRIGTGGIFPLTPLADTADKGFARSTGSDNYALVDDVACDGDSTYVQANSVGVRDLYRVTSLSGYGTIHAVGITGQARAFNGAGALLNPTLLVNSSTVMGSATLTNTYAPFQTVWETDPATGAAWTGPAVNSVYAGMTIG